jgi:transcriptional regulator with XRE-family HTH domain
MDSYREVLSALGQRARELRFARDLKQAEVARRAGLGLATVQRFERSGRASIENVLRIAMVLGAGEAFGSLFEPPKFRTLDEVLALDEAPKRQRVRSRG